MVKSVKLHITGRYAKKRSLTSLLKLYLLFFPWASFLFFKQYPLVPLNSFDITYKCPHNKASLTPTKYEQDSQFSRFPHRFQKWRFSNCIDYYKCCLQCFGDAFIWRDICAGYNTPHTICTKNLGLLLCGCSVHNQFIFANQLQTSPDFWHRHEATLSLLRSLSGIGAIVWLPQCQWSNSEPYH